jgi:CBS domain-containing protein
VAGRKENVMQVKEIMTPKVEWIAPDTTIQESARKMRELNVGSLPVWTDGELIGMVTDRDICCRAVADGHDPATTKVRDIMSAEATYCFEDQELSEVAQLMEEKHIRRLTVFDRDKAMVGFLSVGDLARSSHDLAGEVIEAVSTPVH